MADPLFIKKSDIDTINREVSKDIKKWLEGWVSGYNSNADGAQIEWTSETYDPASWSQVSSGGSDSALVFLDPDDWSSLLFDCFGEFESDEVSSAVAQAFRSELTQLINKSLKLTGAELSSLHEKVQSRSAVKLHVCELFHDGVSAEFAIPELYYSKRCKPKTPKAAGGLSDRASLVKPAACRADVVLPIGEYEIDVLQNLAVGDVLASTAAIDSPFYLQMNKKSVLTLRLGQENGHKAGIVINGEN